MVRPLPLLAIVAIELDNMRAEMAAAKYDEQREFRDELRKALGNEVRYISCLSSTISLTHRLMSKGEQILYELEQNGRPIRD